MCLLSPNGPFFPFLISLITKCPFQVMHVPSSTQRHLFSLISLFASYQTIVPILMQNSMQVNTMHHTNACIVRLSIPHMLFSDALWLLVWYFWVQLCQMLKYHNKWRQALTLLLSIIHDHHWPNFFPYGFSYNLCYKFASKCFGACFELFVAFKIN